MIYSKITANQTNKLTALGHNQYKVYTKEDYRRYVLSKQESHTGLSVVDTFNELWDKLSKGYKFIIVLEAPEGLHVFSVDYFNNEML